MATKRRRKSRNFVAIPFDQQLALATLNDNIVLSASTIGVLTEDLFVISVDATWSLRGHTATEGPIEVGFAHGDLTDTEIAEALDASVLDPSDIIAGERARRPVRRSGKFSGLSTEEVLANGEQIRTKCKFTIGSGKNFDLWASNRSGANLTTGTIVEVQGTIYGRWRI